MGDNERLCEMEPYLHLKKKGFSHEAGTEPRTSRSAGQCLTYRDTEAPKKF